MPKFKTPQVLFYKRLPKIQVFEKKRSLVIADQILQTFPAFQKWILQFEQVYWVKAGEELKELQEFPGHFSEILKKCHQIQTQPLQIVAVGGGSVGDFAGFVASVLKRGVDLVQMPSTWLAAVDSSHGGKTALNAGGFKNQMGSFYQAHQVWLCEELLACQPAQRIQEVQGEVLKTALLSGGTLWKKVHQLSHEKSKKEQSSQILWKLLPELIAYKYKIVKKDPFEKKGIRHLLNLGHTLGHLIESELGLAHGLAVLDGLLFSVHWSVRRGFMSQKDYEKILPLLPAQNLFVQRLSRLQKLQKGFQADKKQSRDGLRFIFLRAPGRPVIKSVSWKEFQAEFQRQQRTLSL